MAADLTQRKAGCCSALCARFGMLVACLQSRKHQVCYMHDTRRAAQRVWCCRWGLAPMQQSRTRETLPQSTMLLVGTGPTARRWGRLCGCAMAHMCGLWAGIDLGDFGVSVIRWGPLSIVAHIPARSSFWKRAGFPTDGAPWGTTIGGRGPGRMIASENRSPKQRPGSPTDHRSSPTLCTCQHRNLSVPPIFQLGRLIWDAQCPRTAVRAPAAVFDTI